MSWTRAKHRRPWTSAVLGFTGTASYPRRHSSSNSFTLKFAGSREIPAIAITESPTNWESAEPGCSPFLYLRFLCGQAAGRTCNTLHQQYGDIILVEFRIDQRFEICHCLWRSLSRKHQANDFQHAPPESSRSSHLRT